MADQKSAAEVPTKEEPTIVDDETVEDAPVEESAPVVAVAASEPEIPDTHHHVALRDFAASFEHQVLRFAKDEVIDSRIGRLLRGNGAPIKIVEKPTSGETKELA